MNFQKLESWFNGLSSQNQKSFEDGVEVVQMMLDRKMTMNVTFNHGLNSGKESCLSISSEKLTAGALREINAMHQSQKRNK